MDKNGQMNKDKHITNKRTYQNKKNPIYCVEYLAELYIPQSICSHLAFNYIPPPPSAYFCRLSNGKYRSTL